MLDVIYSVDTEIWCDGWQNIDAKFPDAFRRYIYGPTPKGDFGLPYQLRVLNEHGLNGVFFVEPLFSGHFGRQPLAEIVGLITDAQQEIQLHLHTEWVDESTEPILRYALTEKKQHLHLFSQGEQTELVAKGKAWLEDAGAVGINAFRAGSFGCNQATLPALKANAIQFDSSYNATMFGLDSGILPGILLCEPIEIDGVWEYPMTVYQDRPGHLRHTQLAACSFREIEGLLWQALEEERTTMMILSHNFELLSGDKSRPDKTMVRRFHQLCEFLEKNDDSFRTCGFTDLSPCSVTNQPPPMKSTTFKTGLRTIEQIMRRVV